MQPIAGVRLRPNGDYINIDLDGTEVGYLRLDQTGSVEHRWAHHYSRRRLIDLVAQTYEFAHAITPDPHKPSHHAHR